MSHETTQGTYPSTSEVDRIFAGIPSGLKRVEHPERCIPEHIREEYKDLNFDELWQGPPARETMNKIRNNQS